jgi:hypothetical protein
MEAKPRNCHHCGQYTEGWCEDCTAKWDKRPAVETMTVEQRLAEIDDLFGPLEVRFTLVHQRIEQLMGRSVWTHELAYPWMLKSELANGDRATLGDVMDKIPAHLKDKTIVVEVPE